MSSSDAVRLPAPLGRGWDLGENVVDLEGGMQLIYEGEGAMGGGSFGVVFPCKLKLGKEDKDGVIDAVVKCENRERHCRDGYEIHKVKRIAVHGNIVQFYGGKVLGPSESENFGTLMVFERMDCTLKEMILEDPTFAETCTYRDLIHILQQVAQGLKHVQAEKYIHLDLKPENVLVAKNPRRKFFVKIADFGVSKAVTDGSYSGTATERGTQPYMAPEVRFAPLFRDKKKRITALADVYSFGMLMCALFNAQSPPFTHQAWGSHGREILVGNVQPQRVFCGAPQEMCNLIEKCLRFKSSGIDDSRSHRRPSFEEILKTLRNMQNCEWFTQRIQTKEQQGEHPSSASEEPHTDEVSGANPASKVFSHNKENLKTQDETLSRAAITGDIKTIRNLLRRGADANLVNSKYGWSVLHFACGNGHTAIADLLLDSGADVNFMNTRKRLSALHLACGNGHTEVAKLLLESGAYANLVDKDGSTPLQYARAHGHTEVANLLLEAYSG